MKRGLLLFVLTLSSLAAQEVEVRRAEPANAVPVAVAQPVVAPAVPAGPVASDNEVALFLAGVPLPDGSPLAGLQKAPHYASHVAELAKLSQHYDKNYYSKIRAWSAAELAPRVSMTRPVYYFFGGPDAVSALAYFPEAPVYVLGGLEPVGSIAPLQTLTEQDMEAGLANLRQSAKVILSYGHFITKDMKTELDRTAFRGVLPLIYTFLSLSGHEILATSYVGIRKDGSLQEYGNTYGGGAGTLPGVKVTFRNGASGNPRTIYYVQANVADDALKSSNALLKWTGSFGSGNVYLKAASYLMHENYFSRIRSFLLSNAAVLQDDSGIPYRFFQEGDWRCWFFGQYTGTLDIFSKYQQPDLQAVYAAPGAAQPLPFGTGYKWRLHESNLLLAVRQAALKAQPATP